MEVIKITYDNILERLRATVPEFIFEDIYVHDPMVVFVFFAKFLADKIALKGDLDSLKRSVQIVDHMINSNDPEVRAIMDDFLINLHDRDKMYTDYLKAHLSKGSVDYLNKSIAMWERGNLKNNPS